MSLDPDCFVRTSPLASNVLLHLGVDSEVVRRRVEEQRLVESG